MINKKHMSCSKNILGGTPVFVGTRVPIQALIDYFEEGSSTKEFLDDFPTVSDTQVADILRDPKKLLLGGASEGLA